VRFQQRGIAVLSATRLGPAFIPNGTRTASDAIATFIRDDVGVPRSRRVVLTLLRVVFAILAASERVAAKAEKREATRGLRERLDQFTR
jgi:hypothetical protein